MVQSVRGPKFGLCSDNTIEYPLDAFSAVRFACSTRRLLTSYTGPAMRVRRGLDSIEQDAFFGSDGQMDTAALLDFVTDGGNDPLGSGFVVTWYDQSGNGNNLAAANADDQPLIVDRGQLVTALEKATVRFDDSLLESISDLGQMETIAYFGVARADESGPANQGIMHSDGSNVRSLTVYEDDNNFKFRVFNNTGGTETASSIHTYSHFSMTYTPNVARFWINEESVLVQDPISDGLPNTWDATLRLGIANTESSRLVGLISEVIIYGEDMNDSREDIDSNIHQYWFGTEQTHPDTGD